MIDNSLLLNIAVSVVIGGIIIYYFSKRMVDLNKKTNAMFEVVQALSKENEQRKLTEYNQQVMQQQQAEQTGGENLSSVSENDKLITVKDNLNEESDNEDYESDSESVDDTDEEECGETDTDQESNKDVEFRNKMQNGITVGSEISTLLNEENLDSNQSLENTVKVVDITETKENNDEYTEDSESESDFDSDSDSESDSESGSEINNHEDDVTQGHSENENVTGEQSEESNGEDDGSGEGEQIPDDKSDDVIIEELNINNMSNINIDNSNQTLADKNVDVIDYKKTPVKILREIVKEKGLITDPSKTKKSELLKLLQSEE